MSVISARPAASVIARISSIRTAPTTQPMSASTSDLTASGNGRSRAIHSVELQPEPCLQPRSDARVRDTLFLLTSTFTDPAYPGRRFYCEHCVLMEGVLAAFPHLNELIDVRRI